MNILNTIGRVTRDFSLKTSNKSGRDVKYINFGLAYNRGGIVKRDPLYYECTIFGENADRMAKAGVRKGSLIWVNGKFDISEFVKDGQKMQKLVIIVSDWGYIPTTMQDKAAEPINSDKETVSTTQTPNTSAITDDDIYDLDMDDDLPF